MNEGHHFGFMSANTTEQTQLILRAHQIMLVVVNLIIGITIDVIGQESHALHVRKELGGIRQILYFDGFQEALSRLKIALRKCLEDIHPKVYLVKFF